MFLRVPHFILFALDQPHVSYYLARTPPSHRTLAHTYPRRARDRVLHPHVSDDGDKNRLREIEPISRRGATEGV